MLAGGTVLGQGIVVLASPIITRLYKPSDFGLLAVYGSILGIISVLASMRYETVIPLPKEDDDAANVMGLALIIVVAISLITGVLSLLMGKQFALLVGSPALESYLWLLPVGVGLIGIYQVFNNWAVRKQAFGQIARTKINQGLGSVLTQIGFGVINIKPLGLLIGQVVGLASGASTLFRLFLRRDGYVVRAISLKRIRNMAKRYKKFPTLAALAASLNSFSVYMPAIFLAAVYGPQVAGWFAVTQRAVGMPLNLVSQSIAQVYMGKAASLARSSPIKLEKLFFSLFLRLLILGLLMTFPIVLIAPRLFVFVFGVAWGESGSYLPRLAPLFIAQFISAPFGSTLDILERQELFFSREAIRIILMLGAFLIVTIYGFSARNSMTALGIAGAVGYALYVVFAFLAIKQNR